MNPNFLIVCDHGANSEVHGDCDHRAGCVHADRVALLPWFPDRPGWWAAEGADEKTLWVYPMEGTERGHDPKWLVSGWADPSDPDLRRFAIEFRCPERSCGTWSYRSDDAKLQTLLGKIVTDGQFRDAVSLRSDDSLIVVRLQALHLARRHARECYGLQV